MSTESAERLALELALAAAAGTLPSAKVQAVLAELHAPASPPQLHDLRQRLRALDSPAARELAADIDQRLLAKAAEAHKALAANRYRPEDWPELAHLPVPPPPAELPEPPVDLIHAYAAQLRRQPQASHAEDAAAIQRQLGQLDARLRLAGPWQPVMQQALGPTSPETGTLEPTLEQALLAPDERHLAAIAPLAVTPEQQRFAMELLTLRHGPEAGSWERWSAFLQYRAQRRLARLSVYQNLATSYPDELRWFWRSSLPAAEREELATRFAASPVTKTAASPTSPPPESAVIERVAPASRPLPPSPPPAPPPAEADKASIWSEHVRPLLVEYWYMVAGLVLMVAGASLLAYLTWDRSAVLRYTIMPAIVALFTIALGEAGHWLAKRDDKLLVTGIFLRGGAIAFVPLNFLVIGIATRAGATLLATALSLGCLVLFGVMQRRWAGQVEGRLGSLLGWPLLALEAAMVAAAFLATAIPAQMPTVTVVAFYVLLGVVAWSSRRYLAHSEDALPTHVSWFFGLTLAVVFLEVFAWIHVYLALAPAAGAYALLVVLVGGEVLHAEQRLGVSTVRAAYPKEAWIGYALLGAGLLMGFGGDLSRLLTLTASGVIWLRQARRRPGDLQYWIGLLLLILAGASIAVFPWFPRNARLNLLPALGLGIVIMLMNLQALTADPRLKRAARDIQPTLLLLTAIIAVISQYTFRSSPLQTGGTLLIISAFFLFRGLRERRLGWVHSAMALLAVMLPYIGCADMLRFTLEGNTMAFGLGVLSLLWLAALRIWPHELLLKARSTVLCTYGILAFAAMVQRALLETQPLQSVYDYVGPFLVALALIPAAWYSRSLLPGLLTAVILAVLFPHLKARFHNELEYLGWGAGLGSAFSALALIIGAFVLRPLAALRELGPGDLWMGRGPFPWRRHDYTLFTIPMLLTAGFLAARSCAVTLPMLLLSGDYGWRTVAAFFVFSAAFVLAAIYLRHRLPTPLLIHGAWMLLLGGFLSWQHLLPAGLTWQTMQWPLLWSLLALTAGYLCCRRQAAPWVMPLLGDPLRQVLDSGATLLTLLVIAYLHAIGDLAQVGWLAGALFLLLIWHGLRQRSWHHGMLIFLLSSTLLIDVATTEPSIVRLLVVQALWLEALLLVMEWSPGRTAQLRSLLLPWRICNGILSLMLGAIVLLNEGLADQVGSGWLLLMAMVALLSARGLFCALSALPVPFLLYLIWRLTSLASVEIWHLAVLATALAVLPFAARALLRSAPRLLRSPQALIPDSTPQAFWWLAPSLAAAPLLMLAQMAMSIFEGTPTFLQHATVFVAAIVYILTARYWRQSWELLPAGLWLIIANTHLVYQLYGEALLPVAGVSFAHILAIGLLLTLAVIAAARAAAAERLRRQLGGAGAFLGVVIYLLLIINYIYHADVAGMVPLRLRLAADILLPTALFFRWLMRDAGDRQTPAPTACYHVGLAGFLTAIALLIPPLREPRYALLALAVAPLCFYLRAELTSVRQANARTAILLAAGLLILYVMPPLYQFALFPRAVLTADHYHDHSLIIIVIGILLLRLHAFLPLRWLPMTGAAAVITGLFFGLMAWPGYSPFTHPMAAAWAAILLAHALLITGWAGGSAERLVRRLAHLAPTAWAELWQSCRYYLVAAAQIVIFVALVHPDSDSRLLTPLLLAAATLFFHLHAAWRDTLALHLGELQLLLALHIDFLLPATRPGLIPADRVVWILLAGWLMMIIASRHRRTRADNRSFGVLALLCLGHLLYHVPTSGSGVLILLTMLLLGAATPLALLRQKAISVVTLWLIGLDALPWFHQAWLLGGNATGFRPLLTLIAVVQSIATIGWWYRRRGWPMPHGVRVIHRTLELLASRGPQLLLPLTIGTTVFTALLTVAVHVASRPSPMLMFLWALLWLWLAWAWRQLAATYRHPLPNFIAEGALVGAAALVRLCLFELGAWSVAYDVWASLGVSICLAGARNAVHRQPRSTQLPLLATIFGLPLLTIGWVVFHNLGTNLALVVVGLHCVTFTWLGHDRRQSPYNAVAVVGVVAFVWLLFWAKLDLRMANAYVIPLGIGILTLLQLFGERTAPEVRNGVRLVTLLAMLGSTSWYVILDAGYGIGFHATLLLLSLAAMALGGMLRIRLYLLLGAAGLCLDLAVIATRVAQHLDSTWRMVATGLLLLTLGIVLVAGAAAYKTHTAQVQAWLRRQRQRLAAWE